MQRELEELEKRTNERLAERDAALDDADRERISLHGLACDVDSELNAIAQRLKHSARVMENLFDTSIAPKDSSNVMDMLLRIVNAQQLNLEWLRSASGQLEEGLACVQRAVDGPRLRTQGPTGSSMATRMQGLQLQDGARLGW